MSVEGRDRLPRSGPALLVANHPSTWADVLLLEAVLGRRLHFLAESGQFRPWPRAALIRAFGTLPIYQRGSVDDYAERNAEILRRCEALFDRGEIVVIFPEGISRTDRSLVPLKRGAARLALSYASRAGGGWPFAVIPVGIRYSDRTAFRSDVFASVGSPIGSADLRRAAVLQDGHAEEHLTERIARTLRKLATLGDDDRAASTMGVLESIASARNGRMSLRARRILTRSILMLARHDSEAYEDLARLAHAHERVRRALRVSDRALRECEPRAAPADPVGGVFFALGVAPAIVGALIHALPASWTGLAIRRRGYVDNQIAFARIAAGFLFLTLTYGGIAVALACWTRATPVSMLMILTACALSGMISLSYRDSARIWWERLRLRRIAKGHSDLVDRARAGERELERWVRDLLVQPTGEPL